MMKKFLSIILSLMVLFVLSSCTETKQNSSSISSQQEVSSESVSQESPEIIALRKELEEEKQLNLQLQEELSTEKAQREEAESKINEYEEYEASFSKAFQIERYYVFHEREEVTYTDGTIELITGWEYHFGPWLNRKYRYSYYVIELPITQALQIVRGEDFYDDHPRTIGDPSKFVYNSQECAAIDGQPIMHAYTAWILDYHVSKAEMREVLEIISDIDHSVYDEYNREEINFKSEKWELPNIDVLYSFDQDIINEYYRYA